MNDSVHSLAKDFWLSAFPQLAAITDAAWLSASDAAQMMDFPAGTIMMRPGEASQGFVLLAKGCVRVYERAQNGREIVLYRTQAGEMCLLTLSNLLNNTTYSAEAVAQEEVRAIIIPLDSFHKAFTHSEAFRQALFATLSQRLSDLMHLVGKVAFQRLDLRLASLLGQLFDERRTTCLHVTHQELAHELGTTREVTSRLLKQLERLGCIRLRRGSVELLSSQDLSRLSGTPGI